MKRPFFRTFFITVSTTEDFSPTANCSSLFRKDLFIVFLFYNYLFVSFLIRFSMNNLQTLARSPPSPFGEALSPFPGTTGYKDSSHTPQIALMRSVACTWWA